MTRRLNLTLRGDALRNIDRLKYMHHGTPTDEYIFRQALALYHKAVEHVHGGGIILLGNDELDLAGVVIAPNVEEDNDE